MATVKIWGDKMMSVTEFDNYIDLLIVTLGPDVSGTLSRLNNADFDLDFEFRLRDVFHRKDHINWQDAFLLSDSLFSLEEERVEFLKLVKLAKEQRLTLELAL